jgi:hypothetical protein
VPCGIWGGSRRHDKHHSNPNVHHQKFFTRADALLRTESPDVVQGELRGFHSGAPSFDQAGKAA